MRRLHSRRIKYPIALAGILLTAVAVAVYSILDYQHLKTDGAVLSEAVLYANDVYFHRASGVFFPKGFGEANGSHLLFLIECILILYMAKMFLHRRGLFWGILPPCIVVSLCLMVGKSPEVIDMILMLCGVLGLRLLSGGAAGGGEGFRQLSTGVHRASLWNPAVVLLTGVLLTGIGALSVRTSDVCLSKEKDLQKLQNRMEREITDAGVRLIQRLQSLLGIEQPGVMTNISPHYEDKKVMTIRMEERPDSDVYLRGFIGSHYEGGKWSNPSDKMISQYFSEDDCYGFYCLDYGNIQTALLEKKKYLLEEAEGDHSLWGDGNPATKSLKNMDTDGKGITIFYEKDNRTTFGYFPYDSCLDESSMGVLRLDHDRGFRRDRSVDMFQVKNLSGSRSRVDVNVLRDWLVTKGHVPYYSKSSRALADAGAKSRENSFASDDAVVYLPGDADGGALRDSFSVAKGDEIPTLRGGRQYLWVNNQSLARYYQFALQEYTQFPKRGLEQTKKLANSLLGGNVDYAGGQDGKEFYSVTEQAAAGNTIESLLGQETAGSVIESLRRYLNATTVYSRELRLRSSRLDYVENFLFQEKKGFCEHYATAGALLFRAMGIPSRYVSGYYVPVKNFHKMEDGSYEAVVLDSDAHAWSEVLAINGGWTVADMTPNGQSGVGGQPAGQGQGTEPSHPTPTPVDTGDDAFLKEREGKEEEETLSPDETLPPDETDSPEPTDKAGKKEKNRKRDSADASGENPDGGTGNGAVAHLPYILGGGIFLLVLLSLALLHYNQRAARRRKLKRCKSHREQILLMNSLMEQFLHTCGYHSVKQMTDQEYINFLHQIYPRGQEEKLAEEYFRLLEQARFAQDAGDEEQVRRCRRLLSRFGRAALAGTGRMRQFYVRHVRNWK